MASKRGFDWKKMPRYPESRPADMLESVRRLLQLGASGQVDVVLPGHNQVIWKLSSALTFCPRSDRGRRCVELPWTTWQATGWGGGWGRGWAGLSLVRRSCQYFNCFKQDQIHVDTWGQGQGVATGGGLERYDCQLMNICSWLGWNALIYETKLNTKVQLRNSWLLPSCLGPPPPTLRYKVSVTFYPTFIRPKPSHSDCP